MKYMFKLTFSLVFLLSAVFASQTLPTKDEVSKLYVATFNRAPDSAGLEYWTKNSGLTLSQIAQSFFDQPETQSLYPPSTTNREFVRAVYQNLFNRDPDTAGWDYWEDELNKGRVSKNRFIEAVINGALDNDITKDATILSNKTAVGIYYAVAGLEDTTFAKDVMKGVDAEFSSVYSAFNDIENNPSSIINKTVKDTDECTQEYLKVVDGKCLPKTCQDDGYECPSCKRGTKLSFYENGFAYCKFEYFSQELKNSFKDIVEKAFLSKKDVAGITVAIYKSDSTRWEYALGKASESRAMTVDTPSVLYSITKTITSAQILKLVEQGKLSLDTKAGDILKNYKDLIYIDENKINLDAKISDLLEHRSGIQPSDYSSVYDLVAQYLMGRVWKPVDILGFVKEDYKDVGKFKYSDANFNLLGIIAEISGGKNLKELIDQDLFYPLGIKGKLMPRDQDISDIAEPYDDLAVVGGSGFGNLNEANQYYLKAIGYTTWAAAGMSMTAKDLAKWGYELYSKKGLALLATTRDILLSSLQPMDDGDTDHEYGLGIAKDTIYFPDETSYIAYGHGGGGEGYLTHLYYYPEFDLSIVVLKNSNNKTNNTQFDDLTGEEMMLMMTNLVFAYKKTIE